MRHIKIVERRGETYSYAAVDQKTGEIPLRLSDRATFDRALWLAGVGSPHTSSSDPPQAARSW
jgi:hypothetical protein